MVCKNFNLYFFHYQHFAPSDGRLRTFATQCILSIKTANYNSSILRGFSPAAKSGYWSKIFLTTLR